MKVVILGAGRRGIRMARSLAEEKKEVVVIDEDQEKVNWAMTAVDCIAFAGSGTNVDDLATAGCADADVFVALTSSDETNIISCGIVSSSFNVKKTIAAVKNISYTKTQGLLGVSHIINPYQETAGKLLRDIEKGIYSDTIKFAESELSLSNIFIDEESDLAGKKIRDLRKIIPGRYIVTAISRDGNVDVPDGDTIIGEGDTISIVASEESLEEVFSTIGKTKRKAKSIAIAGSTKITDYFLKLSSHRLRKRLTVLARDAKACQEYSQSYPECLIMNENITREGLFNDEELGKYDLFICITDNDELNMIYASYAKHYGVKNTIALVQNNPDFTKLADHLGIDSVISTQDVTVDSIMRHIHGTMIAEIHSFFGGKLQSFEYICTPDCPILGLALKEINMKGQGIIAGAQKKNGKTMIPDGTYQIEEGDRLLIVLNRLNVHGIYELLGINTEE